MILLLWKLNVEIFKNITTILIRIMDPDDESTPYLKYLNDPTSTNNYFLSSNVELTDGFPFPEICTTDWPENFPVLLNPSLTTDCNQDEGEDNVQLFNNDVASLETQVNEEVVSDEINRIPHDAEISSYETSNLINFENGKTDDMYINFSPIVKENPDGNREIYLTETDINSDSNIIQLLNTDGSVITIDKSILSSLNLPKPEPEECLDKDICEEYFTPIIAHKCKVCSFLCETDSEIRVHLKEKHPELFSKTIQVQTANGQSSLLKSNTESEKKYTIYLCSLCKLAFSDKIELREHMINKHQLATSGKEVTIDKQQPITSNEPEKTSLRTLSNFLIKEQEKARKKVKCTIKGCHMRFAKDEIREKHEQCHIGDNRSQFKCLECEEKFTIWRICCNHLWKKHKLDIGLLSCAMCTTFKTHSTMKLLNHMATHDDEKPFLCSDCGKGFKTLSQVKNHEILHNKKSNNVPNWLKTKQCDVCQRFFANSKSLKKHIQSVHENFKPFICNICGHKTARKAMLELHLRQHTGDKPHKCPHCDYRTGDHNCLRKHIMKHKGETKYKCLYCSYTAIQSAAYKNHIKNRHPGETGAFSCSFCPFTSINGNKFSAHVKLHESALKEIDCHLDEICEQSDKMPNKVDIEDDETQNYIFTTDMTVEETVDTGGITIPAELEL